MLIRTEEEKDWADVRALNASVFESEEDACFVDALRKIYQPVVLLVAADNKKIVGHIMFSPVSLFCYPDIKIMGLAPMAVAPENQREGIGPELVRASLKRCKQLRFGAVVVLGHPEYSPRFGFSPSSGFGIGCEYEVPEDVFMVMELQPGYLSGRTGTIKYHEAFSNV